MGKGERPGDRVHAAVERICQRGCREVLAVIDAVDGGHEVVELAGLDATERAAVVAELRSVMAVYGARDCRI